MRVLLAVGHGGIYSGAAHQALYQIAGLKRAGVETAAVWGPDDAGDPRGFDRLKRLDVPLHIIPIDRRPTPASLRAFRRVLKEFQPDVVECFKSGAQYHALYAGAGLNSHALLFYRGLSRPMDVFQGLKYRLPRVDRVIANCADLKQVMAATGKIPPARIDVVPGEFDPACGDPATVNAAGLCEELGISGDVLLFTQLGNWAAWRGQEITLRAAAELKKRGRRFHLLFAGRETDRLAPLTAELGLTGRVTLSPYRRDPERILKITGVALNASTANESLPGALLNAQAMGIPALASRLAGVPDIIEEGKSGFILPVGDVPALANAMERLLNMPHTEREAMGAAARARALKLFSSPTRTELRLASYRKALEHRRRIGHSLGS